MSDFRKIAQQGGVRLIKRKVTQEGKTFTGYIVEKRAKPGGKWQNAQGNRAMKDLAEARREFDNACALRRGGG